MAILNSSMFRGARKQAGGWVLYKVGGQTIAREVASQVSNPRTPAQMDNRVRLQNVVSVYRANKNWMRGAFENKKQKESDYNAFVSANLSSSQVAFTKQQAAAGAAVAAPYQVSSGSLGSIEQVISESELQTNIYLGDLSIDLATTVGEFATAVIANNNGIVQGMQLSLILNIQQVNQVTGIPYIITRAYEVILDPQSVDFLAAYYPAGILSAGGGADNILYADLSEQGSGAASFILSHTVSSNTRVSEQSMLLYGDRSIYNSYVSAAAISEAVTSYGENEVNFLDSNAANEQGSTPIANGIGYLLISGVIVRPGGSVTGPLASGTVWRAVLLRPVDPALPATGSFTDLASGTSSNLTNVQLSSSGDTIGFRFPSEQVVTEATEFEIVFAVGTEVYRMQYTLLPAS